MLRNILITGGAGFTGINVAHYFQRRGFRVTIFDNLCRKGSESNLKWLKSNGGKFEFIKGDVRSENKRLINAIKKKDIVFHFAGQVAVTTSVVNPREDFLTNALGSLNVLEAIRQHSPDTILLYSSTNKVYGEMPDIRFKISGSRYVYRSEPNGISENRGLDFHSPYGCSKGAADQYIRDYSRIYNLKTIVFRQSCIYGYRQFGVEDQGWVAWFAIAALTKRPITIYGNGKQVRDVLFIDDLIRGYDLAVHNSNAFGQVFNVGGGPKNTMSLLELVGQLECSIGSKLKLSYAEWRPGDQPVYISDIKKAKQILKWEPKIGPAEGVRKLVGWVNDNKELFAAK